MASEQPLKYKMYVHLKNGKVLESKSEEFSESRLNSLDKYLFELGSPNSHTFEMPSHYTLEMVADWKAAGKVYTGKEEAKEWYFKDPTRFQLHPSTKNTVEGLLLVYEDPKNSPHCSCGVDKFWSKKPWYKHRRHCALYYSVVGIKEALDA